MALVSNVVDNGERVFRGIGVSPGVVRGRIVVMDHDHNEEPGRRHIPTDKHSAELDRLQSALAETRREISEIQRQVQDNLGDSESAIFDAHLLVLEDSTLIGEVKRFVETENVNVDYAFHAIAEKYAQMQQQQPIDPEKEAEAASKKADAMKKTAEAEGQAIENDLKEIELLAAQQIMGVAQ